MMWLVKEILDVLFCFGVVIAMFLTAGLALFWPGLLGAGMKKLWPRIWRRTK